MLKYRPVSQKANVTRRQAKITARRTSQACPRMS